MYNIEYDYLIMDHGATIIDVKDNILYNSSIDNDIICAIIKDLNLECATRTFCSSQLEGKVSFNHKDLTKIYVQYPTEEMTTKIKNDLIKKYSKYINVYTIRNNSIEIISNKTNKSHAINLLIEHLNISNENVYTVGDGHSDIEMIRDYNGYRMKNSIEELKKVTSNEVESVSLLINKLLEEK